MNIKRFSICVGLVLSGCGTLAPGADRILITRDVHAVQGCTVVGTVSADASLGNQLLGDFNGAGWYKLRNDALSLHATHVLLTNSRWVHPDQGVAYRCGVP